MAWCNLSPSELLMGRKLRTNLPQLGEQFNPKWPDLGWFRKKDQVFKEKQKHNYDRRHRARALSPLPEETEVWIRTGNERLPGKVTSTASSPRSYWVETSDGGQLQRNRAHLNERRREGPKQINQSISSSPSERSTTPTPVVTSMPNRIMTRSRTGTATNPLDRYAPS